MTWSYIRVGSYSLSFEILMPRNKSVIIGCIYRHPNMQLNKFNECFLSELSIKLSKENILTISSCWTDPSNNLIGGNIITSISDHVAQFLILSNRKFQKVTKTIIYQRNFIKMNKKSFLIDLKHLNWKTAFSIAKKEDVNHSFRKFLNIYS